jgi:predicted AlkP superfamily pyrophosphatase or phosphodiesterase
MSLADTIADRIRTESNPGLSSLQLPAGWIVPNYQGCSIANLTSSIAQLFGAQLPTPPLDPAILDGLTAGVHRVVVVVVDALGYGKLLETLDANPQNGLHTLFYRGARLVPLTSVFPSTTAAALTTLWSGYTPAEHGLLGYQLFMREWGVRANMLEFSPVATQALKREQLIESGLDPKSFLPVPSLPQTLSPSHVPVDVLIAKPYVASGLSRVQIRGAREVRGYVTSSDMWVVLRQILEQKPDERAVHTVYWGGADAVGHTYGASSPTLAAEINNLAYSFSREFLNALSPAARSGTLFLLTADHGQIDTPLDRVTYLEDHPELRSNLVMDFTGEPRAAYLYCRSGEIDHVRDYVTHRLDDRFLVLDSAAALAAGLFGSGTVAPEAKYRIGDLTVIAREGYTLVEDRKQHPLLGRHGGLTNGEMLVPLIAARLD